MRAVKGSLGHSSKEVIENWKTFVRAHGTFRKIDCQAIGG